MRRPLGVTVIAVVSLLAAVYLWAIAATMLVAPGSVSLMAGAPLMFGLELAGPYMALLIGAAYAFAAWGLFRLHGWGRWLTLLILALGIGMLVPQISAAEWGWPVLWYGLQIAVRAAAAWYLVQSAEVTDAFASRRST
jgi:hypothetical protein